MHIWTGNSKLTCAHVRAPPLSPLADAFWGTRGMENLIFSSPKTALTRSNGFRRTKNEVSHLQDLRKVRKYDVELIGYDVQTMNITTSYKVVHHFYNTSFFLRAPSKESL